MPRPKFKQRCAICKKNMVMMYSGKQFTICVDCHMKRISDKIENSKYSFLNIPDELYRKSTFLRSIKENYLRFESLTQKQIEAFKTAVEDVKNPKPVVEEPEEPIEITTDIWSRKKRVKKTTKK